MTGSQVSNDECCRRSLIIKRKLLLYYELDTAWMVCYFQSADFIHTHTANILKQGRQKIKKGLNDVRAATFFGGFFAAGTWERDTETGQLWCYYSPSYFVMTLVHYILIFNSSNYIIHQGFRVYICLAYPQKCSWRNASAVSFISAIFALWVLVLVPDLVINFGLPPNQTWKELTVLSVDTGSFSTQWLVYCLAAAESGLHSHLRLSFFITDCLLWDIKWLLPCAALFCWLK